MKKSGIFISLILSIYLFSVGSTYALTLSGTDSIVATTPESAWAVGSELSMYDQSSASLTFASIAWLDTYDQSDLNLIGFNYISWLNTYGESHTSITSSESGSSDIGWLITHEASTVELYSATRLSWLLVNDTSEVIIYASDYSYSGGHLSVSWLDGGGGATFWAFNEAYGPSDVLPDNIRIVTAFPVPESMSLLLLLSSLIACSITLGRKRG